MKFKKGDKLEVMSMKEVPISWRVAEILSSNGHSVRVRYDSFPGFKRDVLVESVLRKFVRPCPPPLHSVDDWVCGDVVEVFHEFSWKIAAVLKILGGKKNTRKNVHVEAATLQNMFLVRLMGTSQELIVDRSNMRMQQTWHDDKWILLGKNSMKWEDTIANKPSTSNCYQKVNIHTVAVVWEPGKISSRSLKRMSPYNNSITEVQNGRAQKLRAVEKDRRKQRTVTTPVLEKVDAVGYPKEYWGEKSMRTSFNIISHGYNQIKREKQNDVIGCSGIRNSESSSSGSDACSVGSCSVTSKSLNYKHSYFIPLPDKETDDSYCSDKESCCGEGYDKKPSSLPSDKEVEISIRRLELHAYRSTLEALYASGPLSWDQEALLTNLRIMLHVSNDEHLTELKHLISAKNLVNVR